MAKIWKDYRKESRSGWGAEIEENQIVDRDSIKLGALLRIADAAELMAKYLQQLINERDQYKRYYEEKRESCNRMGRRISALQGVITRMKKKSK